MKKILRIALIIVGMLYAIHIVLGQTGMLSIYNNSTTSNEPNLRTDSKIVVSNLVEPEIADFVCYNYENKMLGKHIRVHRLCGFEHDTLEIINGIVYLNNRNLDKDLNLMHSYKVTLTTFERLKMNGQINEEITFGQINPEFFLVTLEDNIADKYNLKASRIVENKGEQNDNVKQIFNQNWNNDNLGPLIIPKDKIFVIGDNRDHSEDSRFIGFIDKADIVGIIIKK